MAVSPYAQARPDVKVVQFGYDIVQFGMVRCRRWVVPARVQAQRFVWGLTQTASCRQLGNDLFPYCRGDTTCMNNEMYSLQYEYVDVLSRYYNGKHNPLNLLGTLQAARPAQVPAPYPNAAYFSPAELMNDCIHPNDDGFDVLFDRMFEAYWRAELDGKKH